MCKRYSSHFFCVDLSRFKIEREKIVKNSANRRVVAVWLSVAVSPCFFCLLYINRIVSNNFIATVSRKAKKGVSGGGGKIGTHEDRESRFVR